MDGGIVSIFYAYVKLSTFNTHTYTVDWQQMGKENEGQSLSGAQASCCCILTDHR